MKCALRILIRMNFHVGFRNRTSNLTRSLPLLLARPAGSNPLLLRPPRPCRLDRRTRRSHSPWTHPRSPGRGFTCSRSRRLRPPVPQSCSLGRVHVWDQQVVRRVHPAHTAPHPTGRNPNRTRCPRCCSIGVDGVVYPLEQLPVATVVILFGFLVLLTGLPVLVVVIALRFTFFLVRILKQPGPIRLLLPFQNLLSLCTPCHRAGSCS